MLRLIKRHSHYLTYECSICFRYTEIVRKEDNAVQTAPPFCRHCQTDKYNWYYGITKEAPAVEEQHTPFIDPDR